MFCWLFDSRTTEGYSEEWCHTNCDVSKWRKRSEKTGKYKSSKNRLSNKFLVTVCRLVNDKYVPEGLIMAEHQEIRKITAVLKRITVITLGQTRFSLLRSPGKF